MALRKVAGPFPHKDLYGNPREASIDFWCNELDGFLASSSWLRNNSAGGSELEWGAGVLQMDGTFTPRRSLPYGNEPAPYYDLSRRQLAYYRSTFSGGPPEHDFVYGGDWFILQPPYSPQSSPITFGFDGTHAVDTFTRMFLPDRIILLGYKIESQFFVGVHAAKIFTLPYGYTTATVPVVEHVIQTEAVLGSGVWEAWRTGDGATTKFMQSNTPERTVLLVWSKGTESRALEYDYITKQVVGWVRRLGTQPGMLPFPRLVGYSVKHKLWAVQDDDNGPEPLRRLSLFADEAVPFSLSNPVALSPTRRGEAVRYRVRLIGADNDPCIGHRVSWTCSAIGTVLIPQSVTDQNGFAETLVAYPPNADGPWEGTNISAEVIF